MPTDPKPRLVFRSNAKWKNKHGNIKAQPRRLYDVWNRWDTPPSPLGPTWRAGLAALQEIIRTAEQDGLSARALGGSWSLSDAAVTPDFMLNTKPLNALEIGFGEETCAAELVDARQRIVFAQCGVSVSELNRVLEKKGLSLATSGASNGQTICGAVSTGTHGSANQVGSMQDFIRGFHLVSEGGRHCWVERASRPAVTQHFCDLLGTTLRRDDALFQAARVAFGSFGIIHAVLFVAEPIYLLQKFVKRFDYQQVRDVIGTLDVSALNLQGGPGLPYHFSVTLNPYAAGPGEKGAYVTWMFKRPFVKPPIVPEPPVTTGPGDDLLAIIGTLSDAAPALIPAAVEALLNRNMPEDVSGNALATHGNTFGATDLTPGGLSCELGVAIADAPRAVDAILRVASEYRFAGAIALRFVPPSDAFLAFTRFSPFTCTIELVMAASGRSREAYERIWNALEQQQIPHSFHWGQAMRPNFQRLQQVYAGRLDQWLAARREFLSPAGRRTFANALLVRWGIDQ